MSMEVADLHASAADQVESDRESSTEEEDHGDDVEPAAACVADVPAPPVPDPTAEVALVARATALQSSWCETTLEAVSTALGVATDEWWNVRDKHDGMKLSSCRTVGNTVSTIAG